MDGVSLAPAQPDIAHQPDLRKYQQRTQIRLRTESLATAVPAGLPPKLESPLVWTGADFKGEEWVFHLSDSDRREIVEAQQSFRGLNLASGQICQSTFPLPTLGPQLRQLSKQLHCGRGFFVIRGFPVGELVTKENVILAYAGVSSYVASLRALSDRSGATIVHVTDLHQHSKVGTPAYTNDRQGFHTDNGDVSLLALSVAEKGGTSKLASSWHIYNVHARTRPDLIHTMIEPWPCDKYACAFQAISLHVMFQSDIYERLSSILS